MSIDESTVRKALARINDPETGKDLVASDYVRALTVEDGKVRFVLEVPAERGPTMEPLRRAAEEVVKSLPGVESASVLMTAHSAPSAPPSLKPAPKPEQKGPEPIPGVKRIIAIASGKGGVGKSTVSANLAVALARAGQQVGLLDADIYGPSQHKMFRTGQPQSPDGKTMIPPEAEGIKIMSIGMMMKEGEAAVWRGPMLMGALQQLMFKVNWGDLDVLIVDLPPGTGDVQLTLAQKAQVDGAIIVSTPQDIALIDARKAIDMLDKLDVPVLGLVENMSMHVCSKCGHEEAIFGHGGAEAEAKTRGLPFLGALPLDLQVRLQGDEGRPIVATDPNSAPARAFLHLAESLNAR